MALNFPQKISVAIMDILIIAELFLSIHWGQKDPENFTPLVFKYFFVMLVPTLIVARIVTKRLRTKEPSVES